MKTDYRYIDMSTYIEQIVNCNFRSEFLNHCVGNFIQVVNNSFFKAIVTAIVVHPFLKINILWLSGWTIKNWVKKDRSQHVSGPLQTGELEVK